MLNNDEILVECSGKSVVDKHTHFELYVTSGIGSVTVIINGSIADDFHKSFKQGILNCERFFIKVKRQDILRNDELVKGCQNVFRSSSALSTRIYDVEQFIVD